jgi:hypothetical protein
MHYLVSAEYNELPSVTIPRFYCVQGYEATQCSERKVRWIARKVPHVSGEETIFDFGKPAFLGGKGTSAADTSGTAECHVPNPRLIG